MSDLPEPEYRPDVPPDTAAGVLCDIATAKTDEWLKANGRHANVLVIAHFTDDENDREGYNASMGFSFDDDSNDDPREIIANILVQSLTATAKTAGHDVEISFTEREVDDESTEQETPGD